MTQAQQPEALRLAAICETKGMFPVADELNRMHARILELEQGKCLHQIAEPAAVHPDDVAVAALAALMKAKLAKQRAKGCGGWDTDCTQERLSDLLRTHVNKGDPVDVANFCAFLAARGEMICLTDAELINAMEAHRVTEHQRLLAAAPALYVSPEQLVNHTDHLESEAGRYLPARKTAVGKYTMPLYAHPAEGVPAPAERKDLVPGVMRCAKCEFQLVRAVLAINVGQVFAGDSKTEPCPNGCGPLWPVTWKQYANQAMDAAEAMANRAFAAEKELVQLRAATQPAAQGLDVEPKLNAAWKARLLDGAPLSRDKYGCGSHQALPIFFEGVKYKDFFEALGIELRLWFAESEMEAEAYEAMSDGFTEDGENYNAWTPKKPEGDGWCLVAIFDTEDGAACWWLRDVALAAQAKQGGA